jgi:hypothetical protein
MSCLLFAISLISCFFVTCAREFGQVTSRGRPRSGRYTSLAVDVGVSATTGVPCKLGEGGCFSRIPDAPAYLVYARKSGLEVEDLDAPVEDDARLRVNV